MDISSLRRKMQGETLWFCALVLLLIPVYLGQFRLGRISTYCVYAASLLAYLTLAFKLYVLDGRSRKELVLITLALGLLAIGVAVSEAFSAPPCWPLAQKTYPFPKLPGSASVSLPVPFS